MNEQKSNQRSEAGSNLVQSCEPTPESPSPNPIDDSASKLEKLNSQTPNAPKPQEVGGQKGPEPTRYGDWEKNGRCTDF